MRSRGPSDFPIADFQNSQSHPGELKCMLRPCRLPTAISRHFLISPRIITVSNRCYSTLVKSGAGKNVELYSAAPRTIRDILTPSRVALLDLTLAPYLPESLREIRYPSSELPPAYHFLFFPTSTSELDTLSDGYEKHFAPKVPFKRRLWTQGRLAFSNRHLEIRNWAECVETVERVSVDANGTDVWMERTMKTPSSTTEGWSIKEVRCLRYVQNTHAKDEESGNGSGVPLSGTDCLLQHTFTPSQILLTRYSYLTHNFHRIHIDPQYARSTEGYPNVLVHGPLSVTFILTILSRFYISQNTQFKILTAKYVMYRPLYADNPTTLTITNTKSGRTRAILWNHQNQKSVECIITHLK